MKPMTLKITNPPPTLVAQLMHDTTTASLEKDTNTSDKHDNVNQLAETFHWSLSSFVNKVDICQCTVVNALKFL